jgi:hypothetical protein
MAAAMISLETTLALALAAGSRYLLVSHHSPSCVFVRFVASCCTPNQMISHVAKPTNPAC